MIEEEQWEAMKAVAAAGSVDVANLDLIEASEAAEEIVSMAPEHIQDNFKRCCAYFIYRSLLIEAVKNGDVGQMYAAQTALEDYLDSE